MPGPVRADGLFFACAKSKVKSTRKGSTPYVSPGKGARPQQGGNDAHVSARPDLFFAGPAPPTRPELEAKRFHVGARTSWSTQPGGGRTDRATQPRKGGAHGEGSPTPSP